MLFKLAHRPAQAPELRARSTSHESPPGAHRAAPTEAQQDGVTVNRGLAAASTVSTPPESAVSSGQINRAQEFVGVPLLRGREKLALLRHSPLFSMLSDDALVRVGAAAVERELKTYQSIRPTLSIFVLVYGSLTLQHESAIVLTSQMPPELLATAPSIPVLTAATAIASDAGVAGSVNEPGATLGVANLTGGLTATPPTFQVAQPSVLLQIPLDAVGPDIPGHVMDVLASEANLRMLLPLRAFQESSAPVPKLRTLGSAMKLQLVQSGTTLLQAGDQAEHLFILVHGRVDLFDSAGALFDTVDASMSPPLGKAPAVSLSPVVQTFTAVTTGNCYVLVGGPGAADALGRLLAPVRQDEPQLFAAGAVEATTSKGTTGTISGQHRAADSPVSGGMTLLEALAAMRAQATVIRQAAPPVAHTFAQTDA